MSFRPSLVVSALIFLLSCGNEKKESNGPIILGDSSMIVTETDPKYLTNFVDDIQLRAISDNTVQKLNAEAQKAQADIGGAQQTTSNNTPAKLDAKGLTIAFKEVAIFIPGVEAKTYRQQDLQKASGATYQWLNGKISGNQLQISGATITKVSQRYTTNVVAKSSMGTLQLDALNHTTDWSALKGNGNNYIIATLENPQPKNVTPAQIRLAVSRAARNKRMSRQQIQKWEREVRNVRSLTEKPFEVNVRAVMWKIEGKDAQGKPFQKQIRMDIG